MRYGKPKSVDQFFTALMAESVPWFWVCSAPYIPGHPVHHQDVVLPFKLTEVEVDGVARKQVEHIGGVTDLDFILSVASGEMLTRITGTNHFLCISIHTLPPNLTSHLLDHSIVSPVVVGMG